MTVCLFGCFVVCLFVCQWDYTNPARCIFLKKKSKDGSWSNLDPIKF